MKWLNKLDRKYHNKGIPNLMAFIVLLKAVSYVIGYMDPSGRYLYNIALIPSRVLGGEVWRLFTYIATPPSSSPIFVIFALMLIYTYGQGLEHEWGTFRFNLFYLIGYLCTTLSAFIGGGVATTFYLDLSIFWAFAMVYPNFTLQLYFVFPVKVKYLAGISGILTFVGFLGASATMKLAILMALFNFILFFARDIYETLSFRRTVSANRRRFNSQTRAHNHLRVVHKCAICGITEQDDPNMEFRYCSQCDDLSEYCIDHLRDHKHVKNS